jgi:biotin carboxyl carrier protein
VPDAPGLELIRGELNQRHADAVLETSFEHDGPTLIVDPAQIIDVLRWLRDTPGQEYRFLSSLHVADYLPAEPRFGVHYELLNMDRVERLRVRAALADPATPGPGRDPAAPGREAEEAAGISSGEAAGSGSREAAGIGSGEPIERSYQVEVGGKLFDVKVFGEAGADGGGGPAAGARRPPKRERREAGGAAASGETLSSPLQGTVLKVAVKQGDQVEEGALICVIEAMKMENEITAHRSGVLAELNVSEGGSVSSGDSIAVIR